MQGNINIPDSTITTNLSFRQLVLMNMQQLTNFPYIEKDFDALTDYELLSLVVKFLNDVIANQNEQNDSITRMYQSFLALQDYVNNTKDDLEDAFNNLDDYVRNYFENLDVQEEINNKLDQMLEDGVLEQIIEQFIQSTALWCFDTVADMKLATNLTNGSYVKTMGFYNINDGGSSVYKIRTKEENETADEMFTIDVYNSTLIAEFVNTNNKINIIQVGIDDSSDITSKLNNLFTKLTNMPIYEINFNKDSVYTLEGQININGDYKINGNNATIEFYTKPNNTNLRIFNVTSDNIIDIENLNIDGSNIDQDQWDITSASELNIRRAFYITSKNITLRNVNIINLWGNGVQCYGYDAVTLENCNFNKIGGGFYYTDSQTGANDFFGDGLYFGYHDNEARILLKNVYLDGYVSTVDGRGSRGGIVFENLDEEHTTPGKTYILMENYGILNFNRAIHWEKYKADTLINLVNGDIKQDCSICSATTNVVELIIERSTITHTSKDYNGSHSFRGFHAKLKNCIINIENNAEFTICHGLSSLTEYIECTINNINTTSFNNGKCVIHDSILNFNNSMNTYLIYGTDVDIYNTTFNNSTNTDKTLQKGGKQFNVYDSVFNNINPYAILKDIKSIFYFASNLSEQYMYGHLSNGTIYVNNVLKYKPNIGYTFNATDLVNTTNVLSYKEFGESATVPLFPDPLPNNFVWNCCCKYLMIVRGTNNPYDAYSNKFKNACYLLTVITNDTGVPSVTGTIETSSSGPSGWNRVLSFDTTNNTISKGADHSSSVNGVSYWILPYEYYNSTNF